jgi:hypothetical protein
LLNTVTLSEAKGLCLDESFFSSAAEVLRPWGSE